MCKNPAVECKPIDNEIPMEEGNDTTEDEDDQSEPTDSDSYYTETSSDNRSASESDAESASGNRVTPDMVLLLMLKNKGLISEEKYNEKAEKSTENIKPFVPILPRSDSTDTLDYTKDLSGSEDNDENTDVELDEKFVDLLEELMGHEDDNKAYGENLDKDGSHKNIETVKREVLKDIEMVEDRFDTIERVSRDVDEDNVCTSQDNISRKQSNEETLQQETALNETNKNAGNKETIDPLPQEQGFIENNDMESSGKTINRKEVIEKLQQQSLIEFNQETEQVNVYENIENVAKLEENVKETDNNKDPDKTKHEEYRKLADTKEDSKNMNLQTRDESKQAGDKKTKSFKYILRKLVKENRIIEEKEERISDEYGEGYAEVLKTYVNGLDSFYENNKAVHLFDEENEDLIEFALFLNFYSPSSYKFVTETFNTPLPDHKILCSWYLKEDDQPGLSKRAFKILKQKASGKRLTCALMFGDIFLKNHGRYYNQVDYGGGCNYYFTDKAVLTYVFLLVSLDEDWKIPLGYIFARNIPAETQAEFIRICLTHCHDAGADVVAVTLETPTPAEFLGCSFQDVKNLKTTFKHPDCEREVAVWIDPCLALKSVRHTLRFKGVLKDDSGNKIRWNLIRKLRKLYYDEDDMFDFDQPGFLELRNHIAKVGLTTEIFSESLAPALELCEKLLPGLFRDTAPTRRCIQILNTLYDVLNSRRTSKLGVVEHDLNFAAEYLREVFSNEENELSRFDRENHTPDKKKFKYGYRHFVDGEPICGFIGFLICIESFKHLYATLVEIERRIIFLNPQRLCKVQVEDFVKILRAYDYSDPDYYCGEDFQRFYNRLFDDIEKKPLISDQKLALEHWPLEGRYPPVVTIKLTAGKRFYDDIYSAQYKLKKLTITSHEDRATKLVRQYSRAMDTAADLSTRKNMVGYLAGWIAAKFARLLKCEACIDALYSDKKLWFHKFITSKDALGVCLPSEEVFRICWECERALKQKGSVRRLRVWVLRRLATRFPWSSRRARHHPTHYLHLARAVIAKYIPLRLLVPFSRKDTKRIIGKFSFFCCMTPSEIEEELEGTGEDF